MRALSFLATAGLLLVVACAGPTGPTASFPATTTSPSASAPAVPPDASPAPLPAELVLGQTFGLYYDPQIERVVLVNGAQETGPATPTELWSWAGTAWELLDAAGPAARGFAAIGWDPGRNVLVVQGGVSSSGAAYDETLEWDGQAWTVHAGGGNGPGAREGAGLAFEPDTGRLLLFGGAVGAQQLADMWAWDGETWTLVAETGPRPRFISLMTEDRATGDVLVQGGHWVAGNDGDFLADTWRWDGDAWVEIASADGPGKRVNAPGAWDERLGGIVMFGGGVGEGDPMASDTWLWTDSWTELELENAPGARGGHRLAFDAKREVLVLVGGIAEAGGGQTLDVWELDADGWKEVLPPASPSP